MAGVRAKRALERLPRERRRGRREEWTALECEAGTMVGEE
jgi:hypothetical protein